MTIQEAIRSRKRFKRVKSAGQSMLISDWYEAHHDSLCCTKEDLLAEDWVLEDPVITISLSNFYQAFADGMKEKMTKQSIRYFPKDTLDIAMDALSEVVKKLGFLK